MENELRIGEYNHLRIIKEVPFGLYLDGYEDEILLPLQYVPETYEIDAYIDVFIYINLNGSWQVHCELEKEICRLVESSRRSENCRVLVKDR